MPNDMALRQAWNEPCARQRQYSTCTASAGGHRRHCLTKHPSSKAVRRLSSRRPRALSTTAASEVTLPQRGCHTCSHRCVCPEPLMQ